MITKNEISSLNLSPTKKDFVQIWNELIEVASKITERWDPTSTNESDPGIVLLKVLAGIADKLNYNIDKNILEAYMPTAAQTESMRKLCELVGYDIKYYQSAATKVRISYTGNTSDLSDDNDEKLPAMGLALPKFTTITNADKDITFVTTNKLPALFTNTTPWVEVSCIEGQISQCESINDNNLINLSQLDTNNRYYLPEIQIAENGIFVYNATATLTDGAAWSQVTNLNTQPSGSRVYKFGYDSLEGRPYLAFPDDIGSLIDDGLFIYFVRTSGVSGNISSNTLKTLELPAGDDWADYSAEQFEVVNVDATSNGANIESLSAAYNNFKKTVGTFDTLVTCRDYMNKIYSLMDANNSPYVSNILVTDIRNDINSAITLCSCNEFGILYKETPLIKDTDSLDSDCYTVRTEWQKTTDDYKVTLQKATHEITTPKIDHFDLVLYPFKTFNKVSQGTSDLALPYNKSFTYTEDMNKEIEAAVDEFKTCAHRFVTPENGDIVSINNYLRLNALIATSTRVSDIEAEVILHNVKVALVNEFNMRNLDFGEEIPFDSILSVIENADSRIKAVSLQEPTVLTTYSIKEGSGSKEYGIVATTGDIADMKVTGVDYDSAKAKEVYNKLVLRNILAGRAALFEYDENFVPNNSEKPYTVTVLSDFDTTEDTHDAPGEYVLPEKGTEGGGTLTLLVSEVPDESGSSSGPDTFSTKLVKEVYETYEPLASSLVDNVSSVEAVCEILGSTNTFKDIKLTKNEVIKFRAPNLITTKTYPAYVYYRFERDASAGSSDGSYADATSLISFIKSFNTSSDSNTNITNFFNGLWSRAVDEISKHYTKTFKWSSSSDTGFNQRDELPNIFNTAIALKVSPALNGKEIYTYSEYSALNDAVNTYLEANKDKEIVASWYPLTNGTISVWSTHVRDCFKAANNNVSLPGDTVLWRLSTTSTYPKGKLVTVSGQRLYAQGGDFLNNVNVGTTTYICKDLGADPVSWSIPENSDVELTSKERLFIHYTPSSTNEDGETVDAEPISIVYEGGNTKDPVILRPSGFNLIPSVDVNKQGTSWKKTVEFAGHGTKELLALAPNEQIELRSISKVELDSPSRLFKNFDNAELEDKYSNRVRTYELKDGEYLFYTDQNTHEAAYYGSGSVLTLDPNAYIPRAQEPIEISQILEQGLSIVPWSTEVPLSANKKITITEYQYTTLVEGDTLNTLTLSEADADGIYRISSARTKGAWVKCVSTKADPIVYTAAGAEVKTELQKIDLQSGPSTSWEVCSFLELATSPGYSQTLRAEYVPQDNSDPVLVIDKLTVYTDTETGSGDVIEIIPKQAVIPASGSEDENGNIIYKTYFEPVSFKLNTVVQSASGKFEKPKNDSTKKDYTIQLKAFSEDTPKMLGLTSLDANITPISVKSAKSSSVLSSDNAITSNINNYWSAIDVTTLASTEPEHANAISMNFMIPEKDDSFGIFSIYVATPDGSSDSGGMLPDRARLFIDVPESYEDAISIFNYDKTVDGIEYKWWYDGFNTDKPTRFYLRSGLNCIKVTKSCSLLIKAEENAVGTLLYDNLRLVKGINKQGINKKLLDYKVDMTKNKELPDVVLAKAILDDIKALDSNHEFYYNVPVENSLAIEFDENINSFFSPYTLYDVNNVNNDFVISKLDVAYLDTGLKIAKSSKY